MALTLHPASDPLAWRERLLERVALWTRVWRPDPGDARRAAGSQIDGMLGGSEVWELTDDGRSVGHVWLGVERGDLVVHDLVAPDAAAAVDVRERVLAEARGRGLGGVQASSAPGDRSRAAFVDDPAFMLVATNMKLDLSGPAAVAGPVRLTAMTEGEFAAFMAGQVESYAEERHAAGEPMEVALELSREQLAELLPEGLASPHQHLFTVREGDTPVGILWLGTERPVVFVYDVVVEPEHRGRGLGGAAMTAAAGWARDRGAPAIGLNVFGPNPARALYDRLGYQVVSDHFRAPLA